MHVVSRSRIASSVAIRSSSSRRHEAESRSQSRFVGGFPSGERVERVLDPFERDARRLAGLDERDPPQRHRRVAALVAVGAARRDEALPLVEAQRRLRDAAAPRDLADGELVHRHLT